MNLCVDDSEQRERGVGAGVKGTILVFIVYFHLLLVVYFQQNKKRRRSRKGKVSR
jgi:hypothetical protein